MSIKRSVIVFMLLSTVVLWISASVHAAVPTPQPEPINPRLSSLSKNKTIKSAPGSLNALPSRQTVLSTGIPWSKLAFESLRDGNWELYIVNGDGSELTRLTSDFAIDVQPRLNRGCTRLAYTSKSEDTNYDIFTMDIDGTDIVQLTSGGYEDISPAWSPDGSKIAFEAYRDGQAEIYLMNSDGSGQTRLTYSEDFDGSPAWSPDGTKIAFVSRRTGGYRIWVMNADGSDQIALSDQPYSENPLWSPDGSKIAYDADGDNNGFQELWLMNANGADQQVVFTPDAPQADAWAASWSPDGRYLAFTNILWEFHDGEWYWWWARLYAWDSLLTYNAPVRLTAEDTDWKADWQTTDNSHPSSYMSALPRYSRAPGFPVTWDGEDMGESGLGGYDVQYQKQPADNWLPWLTNSLTTQQEFSGTPGDTIYFRARAHDNAWNYEPWSADYQTSTTLYSWKFSGDVVDIRGIPIQAATLEISPTAITPVLTDSSGDFLGHLLKESSHTIELIRNGYTAFIENISFYKDKNQEIVLAPTDDLIQNGDFEEGSLSNWQISGAITPTITSLEKQHGSFSAMLGRPYFFSDPLTVSTLNTVPSGITIAFDNSGVAHTMWDEYDQDSDKTSIMYTACDRDQHCTSVQSPFMGNHPTLETDREGQIHAAWLNGYTIYYSRLLPSGSWSTPEFVGSATDYYFGFPDLAFDSLNQAHIVWSTLRSIFYAFKQTNQSWSQPERLTEEGLQGFYHPVIAISEDDYIHVAWSTYHNYIGYRGRPLTGSWEPIHIIDELYGYDAQPGFAICPDGTLFISWADWQFTPVIAYLISRNTDGSWTSPVALEQFERSKPKLLCKTDGTLIVFNGQDLSYRGLVSGWSALQSVFGSHRSDISDDPTGIASNPSDDELAWAGFTLFDETTDVILSRFTVSEEHAGESRISQQITIPMEMHNPSLSLHAKYVTDDTIANDHFNVFIDDGTQVTDLLQIGTEQEMTHYWFDMQDWVSKTITVTFSLSTKANDLHSTAYIDEVRLGSWVTPIVYTITPGTIQANSPFTLTVRGENFIPGVTTTIDNRLDGSIEWIDDQTLNLNFDQGLSPGVHWLWISNPGGAAAPVALQSGTLLSIPFIRK
jgi:Tol biopolymer transport system component